MERDLNFTVTDDRRDDSVRVNGGISEYAEVRSRAAELFRRPGIRVTAALLCCLLWGSAFPCVKMGYEMLNITDTGESDFICRLSLRTGGDIYFSGRLSDREKGASAKKNGAVGGCGTGYAPDGSSVCLFLCGNGSHYGN